MTDKSADAALQAIADMFEAFDLEGTITPPEPMMGGFLCRSEFDFIGRLDTVEKGVRIAEGETKEYRRWHAVIGETSKDGWNFVFQGEWGTYGPFVETDDVVRLQVWAGRCEVPGDVSYGFGLEHDGIVARAALGRLYVASEALRHVSEEALARASVPEMVERISLQMERLAKAA